MGKLALGSSVCAKAPSHGSGTARNRKEAGTNDNGTFLLLLLLLLHIFPAGLRSILKNDFKEPKSPFLHNTVGLRTPKTAV